MIDTPRFVVLDQNESFLCYIDNSSSEGLFFDNESFHTYFNGTAFSLEMNVGASLGSKSLLSNLECGHKIHFTDNNCGYAATIMAVENSNSMNSNKITCWGGSLELNNSVVQAYQATKAMSFAEYLAIFDPEGSLTIRTNELSDKKLKLSWDGESTLLARIISLITNFDAEFRIVQELGDRYKVNRTYIDSYHEYDQTHNGIGQRRNDIRIRYGENATNIERTVDIRELATAIRPEGDDGLTIVGLTKTETDEAGSTEYFTFNESGWIYAPQARDRFPSNLMGKNTNDRYIGVPWSYSTKDKNILYGQGLAELKKLCQPKVTYNVEGYFEGLNLGDIVRIEDYGFEPMLLLEARVYEIEKSWTRPQNTKYTFANYRELANQIDSSLLTEMQKLIEQNKQYVVNIVSSADLQFKNNEGTTDLSPLIIETGKDLTDEFTYAWYKDSVFISDSKTITVTANDVNGKATYTVKAYKEESLRGQAQCTITNVDDGKDGQKGEKGDQGDKGSDGAPGKDGVGIKSTAITYQLGSSGTTAPTGSWQNNVPTLTQGKYLWTRTIWTYTDNTNETGYSATYIAKDGNDGSDGIAGKDGVGITSTSFLYASSTSGTTAPSSGWSNSIPSVPAGSFLWTKTSWNYTDGTTESAYTVSLMGKTGATGATGAQGPKGDTGASGKDGVAGKDGVGISDTTIQYAQSTSGTTKPTSGWQSTIPSVSAGNYLWTRTTLTYSDASSEDIYSVSRIGKDGNKGDDGIAGKDGVGITSTTITYASSTSGTSAPTSGYTASVPSVAEGSFLWTKTVWTYTDNSNETGYSVAKQGAKGSTGATGAQGPKGDTGSTGAKGADGKGVKSTDTTYASSTSGTSAPTSGYFTSVPTVAAGSFLWTKTVMTYTDNSTSTFYSVGKMGEQGPTGPKGNTGATGPKGDSTGIIAASTAPTTDLYVGKLYLNTTNGITYRYTGSSWEIWSIKAEMMSVASLSAINTNIGTVTAGILKSSDNLFQINLNNKSFSMTKAEGTETYNVTFLDGRLSSNIISTYTPYNEYGSLEGAIFEMQRVQRSNGKLTDSTRLEPTGFTNYLDGGIYRQLSFTNQGLEIRPGSTNTGIALNTGIELIGDITYLDLGNKNSTGKDYAARLVVGTNNYCELVNSGGPILLTAQGNNPVNLQGSNANVRNVTNTGWAGISASAFTQQSDSKYKYNIKDMPDRLNDLMSIDFKAYRLWAENGKYQEGILADQNKALPFVTNVELEGTSDYMVDMYSYVTFLAKSLQEAVKKIKELEGTVNEYRREQNNQLSVGTD